MNESHANPKPSILGWILPLTVLAYCLWAVYEAVGSGVLKWGALGEYSLFAYVLLLGLVSSGFVFLRVGTQYVSGLFLLLFLGYGQALMAIKPIGQVPVEMRWAFDFVGYTTACAVIAAGMVLERMLKRS